MASAKREDVSLVAWADIPQELNEIISESKLPVLVKMNGENKSVQKGGEINRFDMHQPMVLFKEVRGMKVYTRNVTPSNTLTAMQCDDSGPVVVIPEQYQGWFRMLNNDDSPLTTIASVARIMPIKFLSATVAEGYIFIKTYEDNKKRDRGMGFEELFHKTQIYPATFKVQSIYEDFVRFRTDKKATPKRKLLRCLRCTTENGTDILLPFDTNGEFYLVEVKKSTAKSRQVDGSAFVYSITDMVKEGMSEGVYIRHVFGDPPSKSCEFTGVLKICDLIKDRTVIATTLNEANKLLELPLSPGPTFIKALGTQTVNNLIVSVQEFLKNNSDKYIRQMKVRNEFNFRIPLETASSNE